MLYDEDQRVPGFPEVAILSNEKVDGKFIGVVAAGDFWHSDQSYRRETSLVKRGRRVRSCNHAFPLCSSVRERRRVRSCNHISALLLGPFEVSAYRRIMLQVRRDLVEPITMLPVCPLQR